MNKEEIKAEIQSRLDPSKRRYTAGKYQGLNLVSQMQCANGFTLSVQASRMHYCSPRDDDGPWNSLEVGFPSESMPQLMEYTKDSGRPTGTVYGLVPVDVVAEVIEANGGFLSNLT